MFKSSYKCLHVGKNLPAGTHLIQSKILSLVLGLQETQTVFHYVSGKHCAH